MKYDFFYRCENCGFIADKEIFQCPECAVWYKFKKERQQIIAPIQDVLAQRKTISLNQVVADESNRVSTGIEGLDRVLGGGLVEGAVLLMAGEPGSGKSTLMLRVADNIANRSRKVHYISGEESRVQIKLRADRMKIANDNILILTDRTLKNVFLEIEKNKTSIVIIDSLQTMYAGKHGSFYQQIEVTKHLVTFAKNRNVTIIATGHITKEESIAGPQRSMHDIDGVFFLENESASKYRTLRVDKNRFGRDDEIAFFQMQESGLEEVKNPSGMYLSEIEERSFGSVVSAYMKGNRAMLYEVQAHVSGTGGKKLICSGVDQTRASLLLSILEKTELVEGSLLGEIFITITGGLKIDETASDLGIMMAILSSYTKTPVDSSVVVFGESSLNGGIRGVSFAEQRIKEIEKLGYASIVLPASNARTEDKVQTKCNLLSIRHIEDSLDYLKDNKATKEKVR